MTSTIDLEQQLDNVCRLCLKTSENMKQLFDLPLQENLLAICFIRKLTELKIPEVDHLPRCICNQCVESVNVAFELVQLCTTTEAVLRNRETRRMLRKIEEEALQEEAVATENEQGVPENDDGNCSEDFTFASKDKYKCEMCALTFNNKMKHRKHEKTHQDSNPFKCNQCSQRFIKKLHLDVHMRSHMRKEDKKHGCKECGQQFIFEYLLKQHQYKHLDKKPYPCMQCGKGCLTAESLRRHSRIHEKDYMKKTYTCDICKKVFAYPSFLSEHMKNHTGEKPHLCSVCGKGFRQSGALHYHQRIHTGYKPFQCKICLTMFMSQSVLKVHMRKHTNERPFICNLCGMSFRQATDLKGHTRTHTGEKPVLCTICGKKMSTTGQLTIHLRSHTGEKPYSCKTCAKSFTTKTILVKHERIHTGERPYVCDICGRAFGQSSTLRNHSETHKAQKRRRMRAYIKGKLLQNNVVIVVKNDSFVKSVEEQIVGDVDIKSLS